MSTNDEKKLPAAVPEPPSLPLASARHNPEDVDVINGSLITAGVKNDACARKAPNDHIETTDESIDNTSQMTASKDVPEIIIDAVGPVPFVQEEVDGILRNQERGETKSSRSRTAVSSPEIIEDGTDDAPVPLAQQLDGILAVDEKEKAVHQPPSVPEEQSAVTEDQDLPEIIGGRKVAPLPVVQLGVVLQRGCDFTSSDVAQRNCVERAQLSEPQSIDWMAPQSNVPEFPSLEATLVEEPPVYDAIIVRDTEDRYGSGERSSWWKRHYTHVLLGIASLVLGAIAATIATKVTSGEPNSTKPSYSDSALYYADHENDRCVIEGMTNLRQRGFASVEDCCKEE